MLARHVDLLFITLTLGVLRGVLASFLFHQFCWICATVFAEKEGILVVNRKIDSP